MEITFHTNKSKESNLVEKKLKDWEVHYKKIIGNKPGEIYPMIDCQAGLFIGLPDITFYLFSEFVNNKVKRLSKKFPKIVEVISFLEFAAEGHYILSNHYEPFDRLGIKTGKEFAELIEQENPEAIKIYQATKKACCF